MAVGAALRDGTRAEGRLSRGIFLERHRNGFLGSIFVPMTPAPTAKLSLSACRGGHVPDNAATLALYGT